MVKELYPDSPCIRQCCLNDDNVCVGCGRTLTEITDWVGLSVEEKWRCLDSSRRRLRSLASASRQGPAG